MPLNAEVLETPGLPTVRLTASDLPNGPGRLTVAENLVPNPSGRIVDGTVTIRETRLPGFFGWDAATTTGITIHSPSHFTHANFGTTLSTNVAVPAGATSFRVYFEARTSYEREGSDGGRVHFNSGGTTTTGTALAIPADGEWHELDISRTISEGADTVSIGFLVSGYSSEQFDVRNPRLRFDTDPPIEPYWDAENPPQDLDPDFTPEWTGTPGASTSRLVAPKPVGYDAFNGVVYYSQSRDCLALTGAVGGTPFVQAVPSIYPAILRGEGNFTLLTEVLPTNPMSVRNYVSDHIPDAQRLDVGVWNTVRNILSVESGWYCPIRLYAYNTGGTAYFRAALIPGTYTGPYFDGSTRSREFATEWTGQPNDSSSRIYADVPEDMAYRISAEYDGGTYTVASGTLWDHSSQLVVADPQAPLGTPVRYSMRVGTLRWDSEPLTRSYDGWDVITDASGKNPVEVLREKGDERAYSPREYVADVPGRAVGPARYGPTAGAPTGAMTVRTDAENSARLHELIMANRPVIYLHNHSGNRCMLKNCDVGLSQTIFVTSVSNNLAANMHFAERIWGLDYRPADDKSPHRESPVATFDELTDAYYSFTALQSDNETFDDVRSGDFLI